MLESIHYGPRSKIRMHISLSDTSVCEDDILERYNLLPMTKTPVEAVYLDPGGFCFSDTKSIDFTVRGLTFSVKPEHLYSISDVSWRELGESWVKVYLGHCCLVVPSIVWIEVQSVISALSPPGKTFTTHFLISIFTSSTMVHRESIMGKAAKTARKNRTRNARRQARELRAVMRGEGKPLKTRNLDQLGLILRNGAGSHGDQRKQENKTLCRKPIGEDY